MTRGRARRQEVGRRTATLDARAHAPKPAGADQDARSPHHDRGVAAGKEESSDLPGATPAAALRTTQIGMIRRAASPRVRASLQHYGSGS